MIVDTRPTDGGEAMTTAATGPAPAKGKRIVVGVDGSEPSKAGLRWAVRATKITGATIDAVIAWSFPSAGGGWTAVPEDWDPAADASTVLAETVDAVF